MSAIALRLPIVERAGLTQAVDARSLHGWLEVETDFSTWLARRVRELELIDGVDIEKVSGFASPNLGSANRADYALSLDAAKHIAMVERNDRGREARAYFIEAEKRLRDPVALLSDPATLRLLLGDYAARTERAEAALVAATAETETERAARVAAEAKLDELDGAVALHERTKRANGTHGFREAAKIIGAGPHAFVEFLESEGYCHRLGKRKRLVANERWVKLARPLFEVVLSEVPTDAGEVARTHRTWITDHGLEVLAGKFRAWRESKRAA